MDTFAVVPQGEDSLEAPAAPENPHMTVANEATKLDAQLHAILHPKAKLNPEITEAIEACGALGKNLPLDTPTGHALIALAERIESLRSVMKEWEEMLAAQRTKGKMKKSELAAFIAVIQHSGQKMADLCEVYARLADRLKAPATRLPSGNMSWDPNETVPGAQANVQVNVHGPATIQQS